MHFLNVCICIYICPVSVLPVLDDQCLQVYICIVNIYPSIYLYIYIHVCLSIYKYLKYMNFSRDVQFRASRPRRSMPAGFVRIDCLYASIYIHMRMHISLDEPNPVLSYFFFS